MKIIDLIHNIIKKRTMHVTLLDPDPEKLGDLGWKIKKLEEFGTDAVLIGGSTNIDQNFLDETIQTIKKVSKLPVILFPGDVSGVSKYADAIFFMSLLNSKDPYWISGAQALGAPLVKKLGIESIPMAYLIVEPGMKAGEVGKADLIKRDDIEKAVNYASAAEQMGMALVYLEAGSGADQPVPAEMIKAVKSAIKIPVIVGGGIRKPEQAEELAKHADIIDTGTITEKNFEKIRDIIKATISQKK